MHCVFCSNLKSMVYIDDTIIYKEISINSYLTKEKEKIGCYQGLSRANIRSLVKKIGRTNKYVIFYHCVYRKIPVLRYATNRHSNPSSMQDVCHMNLV